MLDSGMVSGWYAHARSSLGVGSTGLAKPRNTCTLMPCARSRQLPGLPVEFGATVARGQRWAEDSGRSFAAVTGGRAASWARRADLSAVDSTCYRIHPGETMNAERL